MSKRFTMVVPVTEELLFIGYGDEAVRLELTEGKSAEAVQFWKGETRPRITVASVKNFELDGERWKRVELTNEQGDFQPAYHLGRLDINRPPADLPADGWAWLRKLCGVQ